MSKASINIRISGKLGKKIDFTPEISLHENPYLDWSAHLFRAPRKEYILLANTASLYSIVLRGKGITHEGELIKRSIRLMEDILEEDGFELIFQRIITPNLGEYLLCKALNRSVIGSMNDLVKNAENHLDRRGLSPFETAMKLNEMPFSAIDYQKPREAFRTLEAE
jgi:hypothetical protein